MTPVRYALLAFSANLVFANAAADADRVEQLPGWEEPLPSAWYSGYLSFGKKHLHYVLVEAETKQSTAPLVLWMNGGPGCSSMDAVFYEHGPLLINENGTKLVRNPYSWTKVANVLYLEAPVGVGYSYSEQPEDTQHLNDEVTASDNLEALKVFFKSFPEYKKNDFYVSGESYAGVYVPTLSLKIFQDSTVDWNMKGFIVGNGVFDWSLMTQSSVPFLYGHGAISSRLMAKIDSACHGDYINTDAACEKLVNEASQSSSKLNMYDFYRDCFQPNDQPLLTARNIARQPHLLQAVVQAPRPPHPALGVGENVPCIDSQGGSVYLAAANVRNALHIEPTLAGWEICSAKIQYSRNMSYSAPNLYAIMKDKYKILVYNGDTDMACDYLADSWGVDAVNATVDSKMDWVPWTLGKHDGEQAAGFITKYKTGPGMYFMTVKGAGHMVPQWKPQEALEMLTRFLEGQDMQNGAGEKLTSVMV
jgi:cathepsin A (carboxypeptidase C)